METIMVELYRQQAAQWRLELRLEEEALSLRAGGEAKTVLAGPGQGGAPARAAAPKI